MRLQAVTLEMTEEEVTVGRVGGLGWMPEYPEAAIIPKVDPVDWSLPAVLRQGDFVRRQ